MKAYFRWSVLLAAAVASVLLAFPMTAAAWTNGQCQVCHGPTTQWAQDFQVPMVDRDVACRKCHLDRYAGTHPYHHRGGNCKVCHTSFGASLLANTPTGSYAFGSFASDASGDTPSSILHIIHSKPRWPANATSTNSKCSSCHGIVACDACHVQQPAAAHAGHGDPAAGFAATTSPLTAWVGNVSPGVVDGVDGVDTMQYGRAIRCGAVGCHDIDAMYDLAPVPYEDQNMVALPEEGYPYATSVETSQTSEGWIPLSGGGFTRGVASASNNPSNAVTFRFTGVRVSFITSRDPYYGKCDIYIDGEKQWTADLYSPVTKNQEEIYISNVLDPGDHWITIKPTGTKSTSARAAYAVVDCFKVWPDALDHRAPKCSSCHDQNHGFTGTPPSDMEFSHDATQTIKTSNTWNTGYGTYSCNRCHMSRLRDEHDRTSSSGPRDCTTCHLTFANETWTGNWNPTDGCNYGDCHPASGNPTRTPHANYNTTHIAPSSDANDTCRSCHSPDLREAHNNPIVGNGYAETNTCLHCHSSGRFVPRKNCSDPACHSATGITTLVAHGHNSTKHTASDFSLAYQQTAASGTIDTQGYECGECHSPNLLTAHEASPAVSCDTGGASGRGCHLNTSLNSMEVAKNAWDTDRCSDCHDSGANKTHDASVTVHLVGNNGCAGTSRGCHNTNDLWRLHDRAQNGGPPKYSSCGDNDPNDPAGCHTTRDKRPSHVVDLTNACGSTSTGCHREKTMTHAGFSHVFTTASYYNANTETGCTNQVGCHNKTAGATNDFGPSYHPNDMGCLSSRCHKAANHDDATFDAPTDCMTCHTGGAYDGSPARANLLASPTSGGHYNETTHTAVAASMDVYVSNGGTAKAKCVNCHNPAIGGLANGLVNQHKTITVSGSPYGSRLNCGECHGDTRSRGNAEVVANWTTHTCTDCHATGTSTPLTHASAAPSVTGTSSAGCGATGVRCHQTYDLHALHKNASGGCNLTGCHDFADQVNRPSERRCGDAGGCHSTYSTTSHGHKNDADLHEPTTTAQANATFNGITCGSCHNITVTPGSLTAEHSLPSSAMSTNATSVCQNCHNNAASGAAIDGNWSARNTTSACAACHTGSMAIHASVPSASHITSSTGCSESGDGCHKGNDLSQIGATNAINTNIHSTCLRCHDRTASGGNLAFDPTKKTCGEGRGCHTGYSPSTSVHNGAGGLVDSNDAKHTSSQHAAANYTGADAILTDGRECSFCHTASLGSAHATTSVGAVGCRDCHNSAGRSVVVKTSWPTSKCTACHPAAGIHTNFKDGTGYRPSHEATTTQGCLKGVGCHGDRVPDFGTLHAAKGCNAGNTDQLARDSYTPATSCHDVDKDMSVVVDKSCSSTGACHATYADSDHNGIGTANEPSHEATSVGFDATVDGATYDTGGGNKCQDCHSRGLGDAHETTTDKLKSGSTGWSDTAQSICADCHNTQSPDNAAHVIKTDNWNLRTCAQCHETSANGGHGNGIHDKYAAVGSHNATMGPTPSSSDVDSCSDARCHGTTDVRVIHNMLPAEGQTSGCTASGTDSKGWTGSCHTLDTPLDRTTQMSCGKGSGGCHTRHDDNHVDHNADKALGTKAGTSGALYDYGSNVGCFGCHDSLLDEEHGPSTVSPEFQMGRTMEGGNGGATGNRKGCGVCHPNRGTAGAFSNGSAVKAAIANKDHRCQACHVSNDDTSYSVGPIRAHVQTATTSGSIVETSNNINPAIEFDRTTYDKNQTLYPGETNVSSGHDGGGNTKDWWPFKGAMATPTFVKVNGITLTTTNFTFAPNFGTNKNPRTGAVWTTDDQVLCSDCHKYTSDANGPQGAAAPFYLANATTGTKSTTGASGVTHWYTSRAADTIPYPCRKCHSSLSNTPHKNKSAHNVACQGCHIKIPHGWVRPRLLRRITGGVIKGIPQDTEPYANQTARGLTAYRVTTTQTSFGSSSSCKDNCDHSASAPYWP